MLGEIFRSFKKSLKVKKLTKEYLKLRMDLSSGTAFEILTADTNKSDDIINRLLIRLIMNQIINHL